MKQATIINSPGGFFSAKDLQHCAIAAKGHGLYLGQRQNIIIADVAFTHSELQKLSAPVRSQDYYKHSNNLVCSHAAGGLSKNEDWAYTNEAYLDILSQIFKPPKLKVNLCSRDQSLFPIFSGQLNFITSNQEGYWQLVLNINKQRQLLPFLFRTNQVHQVIKLMDGIHQSEQQIQTQQVMALLAKKLIIDRQLQQLKLYSKHPSDHEGFQQMKNGKISLNIFSNHNSWNTQFIIELCQLVKYQGLARIYLTTGRSLLIKHIEENRCFEWQKLIGKYNITLRHSEQDLSWIVPAEKRALVSIKEKIIAHFHTQSLSFQGLYIALDPAEFECGAQIIICSYQQNGQYNYQVYHKENFDYRHSTFICVASKLNFEQLLVSLYSLRNAFFQRSSIENVVIMQALKTRKIIATQMNIYHCPSCLTQYHEKIGQPHIGIAAGTAFNALPTNWCCELCATKKDKFTQLKCKQANE